MEIIKKVKDKLKQRKEKRYLDFTNESWKSNPYVGLQIVRRAYKKPILALSLFLFTLSFILPDLGLSMVAGIKVLNKWG